MANRIQKCNECLCFAQDYSLNVVLKKFGNKVKCGDLKDAKQLSDRTAQKPALLNILTKDEKREAMENLFFSWEREKEQ